MNEDIDEVPNTGKRAGVLKTAWIIAVIIIISKFIGFLRDVLINYHYGVGLVSDAYNTAYKIPGFVLILLGGVGGPFHSAAVSVFSKMLPENMKADEKMNKLFSIFSTAVVMFFLIAGILCCIYADEITRVFIPFASSEKVTLAALHLKILSPIILIGGLVGIYYGILVTFRKFALPNISPILMSLAIIIAISIVPNDDKGIVLALATTIGAFIQFIVQYPNVRRLGFRFKLNFDFKDKNFHNILELLFPAILSSTIGQIYVYIDTLFTSKIGDGALTVVENANRIFQFPVGILVTAFLVPLFPIFSELVAKKDYESIKSYFDKGVGVLNAIAFPIFISILLLASDGIKIVFQHGKFDASATAMVTEALIFLSIAILPYVFRDTITRIYYAFNDSKTPFYVALSSVLLKFFLNYILILKMGKGIGAITLSTSLVTLYNGAVMGFFLRNKIQLYYGKFFKQLGKMFFAAALTYGVSFIIYNAWKLTNPNLITLLIKTCVMTVVIFSLYIIFGMMCKIEYIKILLERLQNKIAKKFAK